MATIETHYDTLEVTRSASPEVIRAAYRGLSQRYHPDRNPDDRARSEERMKVINHAFAVLSDPQQRAEHDAWIASEEAARAAQTAHEREMAELNAAAKTVLEKCPGLNHADLIAELRKLRDGYLQRGFTPATALTKAIEWMVRDGAAARPQPSATSRPDADAPQPSAERAQSTGKDSSRGSSPRSTGPGKPAPHSEYKPMSAWHGLVIAICGFFILFGAVVVAPKLPVIFTLCAAGLCVGVGIVISNARKLRHGATEKDAHEFAKQLTGLVWGAPLLVGYLIVASPSSHTPYHGEPYLLLAVLAGAFLPARAATRALFVKAIPDVRWGKSVWCLSLMIVTFFVSIHLFSFIEYGFGPENPMLQFWYESQSVPQRVGGALAYPILVALCAVVLSGFGVFGAAVLAGIDHVRGKERRSKPGGVGLLIGWAALPVVALWAIGVSWLQHDGAPTATLPASSAPAPRPFDPSTARPASESKFDPSTAKPVQSTSTSNFATCVLDRMPSSQNDAATYSVMQVCNQQYPGAYSSIPQGLGRGLFGYDSGAECAAKKAAATPNLKAGGAIRVACNCLFDPPRGGSPSCEEQRSEGFTNASPASAATNLPTLKPFTGRLDGEKPVPAQPDSGSVEYQTFLAHAEQWISRYPFLDHNSAHANRDAINAVRARRDQLIQGGTDIVTALDTAVGEIAPKYTSPSAQVPAE